MAKLSKRHVKKIENEIRLDAAHHEAGHLTAALALGFDARAHIEQTQSTDTFGVRDVTGQVSHSEWLSNGSKRRKKTKSECAAICVAGAVAEMLACDSATDEFEIERAIDSCQTGISETDEAGLPKTRRSRLCAIRRALEILRTQKPFFDWAVRELVRYGEISNGYAWDRFYGGLSFRKQKPLGVIIPRTRKAG